MSAECGICCDYLQSPDPLLITPCGHVLHEQCLMEWLHRSHTCPQCRSFVVVGTTRPIYLNYSADDAVNVRNLAKKVVQLQRKLEVKDADLTRWETTKRTLMENIAARDERCCEYRLQLHQLETEQKKLNSKLKSRTEDTRITLAWLKEKEDKIRHLERTVEIDTAAYKLQIERQREQQDKLIKKLTAKCVASETSKRKLEDVIEKQANEIEVLRQQDNFIEELRARCSALETSDRKLESELGKRIREIPILQKSRAKKEEPLSSTELVLERGGKKIATAQEARAAKEKPGPSTDLASKAKRAPRKPLATLYSNTDPEATPQKKRYFLRPR